MKATYEEDENNQYIDVFLTESEIALLPKRTICREFYKEGKSLQPHKILHIGVMRDDELTEEEIDAIETRVFKENCKRKYFGIKEVKLP